MKFARMGLDKDWQDNCQICGEIARDRDPDITVDYDYKSLDGIRFRLVWHNHCLEANEQ